MWTYKVLQFFLVLKIAFVKLILLSIILIDLETSGVIETYFSLIVQCTFSWVIVCLGCTQKKKQCGLQKCWDSLPAFIVCGIHVWAYLDVWGEDVHACGGSRLMLGILITLSSYSTKHGLWIKPEPAESLSLSRQLALRIPCLCSPKFEWQEAHHAQSAFMWFLRIWTPVLRLVLWLLNHYEYPQTLIMSFNISNILKNVQGHWLQYKGIQSESVARRKENH